MVTLFMLAMVVVSLLLFRLSRKASRSRSSSERRPGHPDGVRSVYKRGH
jgi:hypothetical protein